jgi:hypothetical protein
MRLRFVVLAALLAAPVALAEEAYSIYYRIALAPSGSLIAIGQPAIEGSVYLFREYPAGTLVSLREEEVASITPMTMREAEKMNPARRLVSIGTLAMQGGATQGGPISTSAWNVVHGKSATIDGPANRLWSPGTTWAYEPPNAVIAAPGAPPASPR